MKLYRNAIILLVVLGTLVGVLVYAKNRKIETKGETGTDTPSTSINLVEGLDAANITEVTYELKNEKVTLTKKNEEWQLSPKTDLKVVQDSLKSKISLLTSLTADKVVEEDAQVLSIYGLSTPAQSTTIKTSDGKTFTFDLGKETLTKDGYFLKEKGSNKVYVVNYGVQSTLALSKLECIDPTIFPGKAEEVSAFSLEKGGSVAFTLKKVNDTDWNVVAPLESKASSSDMTTMFTTAIGAKISEIIDENPADLNKYGLSKPQYGLEIETKDGKKKIFLGNEQQKGVAYYAKFSDSNTVFTVDESSLNFIDKTLKQVMDPFAYIVNLNDVSHITVDMDGQTTNIDIEANADDKDKDKFTVNGKDATMKDAKDDQPFRKYYQALIGITLSEIEFNAKPVGKADITFTYTLKTDLKTMKVEFIPKDDKYYYVVRNGVYSNLVVEKRQFDKAEEGDLGVRASYKALMEALK